MAACGTYRKILQGNGSHLVELVRVAPDVHEFLPAHIAAGQRELHAGKQIAVWRDVTGRVARAARKLLQDIAACTDWRGAEGVDVAYQIRVTEYALQLRHAKAQAKDVAVAVHHWRDGGVDSVSSAQLCGERLNTGVVAEILHHEDVGDDDLYAVRPEQAYSCDGALERPGQQGDGVVHFGPMGVDADLNVLHLEIAQTQRLFFTDHECVGLDLYAEHEGAGVFEDVEEVHAHEDFAAAQGEKEDSRIGKLVEQIANLGGRHFAVVVVIKVAMDAAFVAAIGDVELHAQRNPAIKGALPELLHQTHEAVPCVGFAGTMGEPETRRMP